MVKGWHCHLSSKKTQLSPGCVSSTAQPEEATEAPPPKYFQNLQGHRQARLRLRVRREEKWEEETRRGETQENLWSCFVLFPEGSITLVWAHVTLGGKTEKEKIGDAGQAPQAPLSMEHCWTGDKFL